MTGSQIGVQEYEKKRFFYLVSKIASAKYVIENRNTV